MRVAGVTVAVAGIVAMTAPAAAQVGQQGAFSGPIEPNVPYDGRFTMARIKYTATSGGEFGFRGRGGRVDYKWDHDYPRSERHFVRILNELTTIRPRMDASNILTLDDPELFKFPFAYLCEVGFWAPTEKEIDGLRKYLKKGGFLIVDDFAGPQWYNFETQMQKAMPEYRLVPLTLQHPIFDSFYKIATLELDHPYFGVRAQFYGVFEDNDPAKRLMMIINYNYDVSEFWEFSDTGMFPIDLSNEAYKLGVNYVIYALTR